MRIPLLSTIAVVVLSSALPGIALAQPPGRGDRGSGGFKFDPGMIFDKYAQGRPYFLISEMQRMREPLMAWAQQNGIKDDKITREQFTQAWPAISENMKSRGPGGGGMRGGPPGGPGTPSSGQPMTPTPGGNSSPGGSNAWKQWAEDDFKRRDGNGDGHLNQDEMGSSLRADLGRWDTNKDGLIDLNEYLPYFHARMEQEMGNSQRGGAPAVVNIEDDLDKRPTVYRAGKLPKELPSWFQELDADNDGQVSLYEWRKGRKPLDDFKEYDRNSDGFLTAEEVLRHDVLAHATATQTAGPQVAVIGGSESPGMMRGGPPGGGRNWGGGGGGGKRGGGKRGGGRSE